MERDAALKVKQRVNQQRANGRFAEHDRRRAVAVAEAVEDIVAQIDADTRPVSERVPEYVLDYDDDGNIIGVKPASS
jgi:hypothetical protein